MKISFILASRIGSISKEMAGTEVMFLNDLRFLRKKYSVKAYARFKFKEPFVERIKYPVFMLEIAAKIKTHYSDNRVSVFLEFLAETIYFAQVFLKTLNSDLIFGYSTSTVALFPNKRRVVFIHSYDNFYYPNIFAEMYKNTQYIFCSKYLRNYYMKKYEFISFSNSTVLYNAVDSRTFHPKSFKKRKKKIKLLFVSAWVREKGLDLLLKALIKLPKKIMDKFTLTIASSKDLWFVEKFRRDEKYIAKLQFLVSKARNITLLGGVRHRDMNNIYNRHDFLIFPSSWGEPGSVSLIESVFSGLPVVAFNVGGNSEILSNMNSIIVRQITPDGLSQVLINVSREKYCFSRILTTSKNIEMSSEVREAKLLKIVRMLIHT